MYSRNIHFPTAEEAVLEFWKKHDVFNKGKELSKDRKRYVFYDGPPFATGLPHYGHILSGTVKDTVGRFAYQQGYRVDRRFGWDCHGLPVEYEIDKKLGITDRQQVLSMGVDRYNDECKGIVMKYSSEWERTVSRMGRWVDFQNGYRTMDRSFMESTWFVFKQLFDHNKVYRGYKVMPFSTACKTPLSNFEANQNYKDVSDPSVLVAFPLKEPVNGRCVEMVAWTTTPWTLPANCLLLVNESYGYSVIEHKGRNLVLHESRVAEYFKGARVVDRLTGSDLLGREYAPPFGYFEELRSKGFFQVSSADFITSASGTAVVHCAPAFGEEDYRACVSKGLIEENGEAPCPVDENGCFVLEPYKGVYIKDLDKLILRDIKERILMNGRVVHSYPFCWRSDTPLIYRLVPNWFIRVKESCSELLVNNEKISWVPEDIKYKRFHNWLEQCRDWAVGRNRFWGTPIPIWATADFSDVLCVGSIRELEDLSGARIEDMHRQHVDKIVIRKDGKEYRRVDEVLDCWFESGAMPYAQDHWPFSSAEGSSQDPPANFPADFIGEGLDQTRGWFYTLHVISTLLFKQPAFRNVLVFGIVLAEDGRKMSKRLKNYPDPQAVFDKHGADSLRLYLISSPVVLADNLRFSEAGVMEITKTVLIPWYNSLSFYKESCSSSRLESSAVLQASDASMDGWIVSSFNNLCLALNKSVGSLHLNTVLGLALKFIDDLSNWYIRINRKRLREDGAVLGRVLVDFATVMAPFTPFFSEYSYQSIVGSGGGWPLSVHHRMYPAATESSHPFEEAKSVIEAVRQMREKLRIKLKRPIRLARIVCGEAKRGAMDRFVELVKEECNLLEVQYAREEEYKYEVSVKPYFEELKQDMGTMKEKMAAIRKMNEEQVAELARGSASVDGVDLRRKDVLIERQFVGVENAAMFGDFGVILDVRVDQEINELTLAREFFSFVQKQRKAEGLRPEDDVGISVDNESVQNLISRIYPTVVFDNVGEIICETDYVDEDIRCHVVLFRRS